MLKSTSHFGGMPLLGGLAAIVCAGSLPAADLNITQVVTYNGQTATMRLTRQNLRGPNFELLKQETNGTFTPVTATPERAYLGTVDEFPEAVASGILTEAGVFRGLIIFDRGSTWYVQNGSVHRTLGWNVNTPYKFPTIQVTPGQAGISSYRFDVAFDVSSEAYTNLGETMSKALEEVEYAAALQRGLYMTNILARPYLARVIVRASSAHDPYLGLTAGAFLGAITTEWRTNHTSAQRNLVAGLGGSGGGGLAWCPGIGPTWGYSIQPWSPNGNSWGYLRHEMAHNFGVGHDDGGSPEGGTINSGNTFARMSTSEVELALNRRDYAASQMTNEGTYTAVDLPPYACMDTVTYTRDPQSNVTIDVLANDYDANGDSLTIQNFDVKSKLGATVSLSLGTGPGGRNQLSLQRLADHAQDDWFTYRTQDSSGQTGTGVVIARGESPSTKLTGTLIGSAGSWNENSAWSKDKAVDGDFSTNYSANSASGDWVGLDLGASSTKPVTNIKFCPRAGFEGRMNGGVFQASNSEDFSTGVVTLSTISGLPVSGGWTSLAISNDSVYRYVRYMGPTNGYCDIADFEFWGAIPSVPNPPNGTTGFGVGGGIALSWSPSSFATSYQIKRSSVSGGPYTTIATGVTATAYTDTTPVSGQRYYYVISADNSIGQGVNSPELGVSAIPSPTSAWKLNAGTGTVAADEAPVINNGTLRGAVSWGSGFAGSALQFNGSNAFVTCGTGPSVSGTSNFSVSAWIKTTATLDGIIVQQRDATGYNGEYMFSVNSTGKLKFMVYGNSAYQFDFATTQSINNGAWHHVVAVRNGLAGSIYIDGNPTPAATVNGTAVRSLLPTLGTVIGRDTLDNNKNFNGSIDEVQVYKNVALSGAEVQGLYNSYFAP